MRREECAIKDDRWLGLALAAGAGLFFAMLPVATRFLFLADAQLDPLTLLSARFLFGAALFWVFDPSRGGQVLPRGGERPWFILTAGGLLLTTLTYCLALRMIPASVAVLLVYTYPAFTAVLARLWFGEPLGAARIGALLLTFGGSAVLAGFTGSRLRGVPFGGMFMALASGFSYSIYSLGCQRLMANRPAQWVNRLTMTAVALIYLFLRPPVFLFTGSYRLLAGGLFLGFVPTFVAFSLYTAAIRRLGATRATLCTNTELVFAVFLAWLLLGEGLKPVQLLGGLMVLGGVVGVMTRRAPPKTA